jgi:hypothetical protein
MVLLLCMAICRPSASAKAFAWCVVSVEAGCPVDALSRVARTATRAQVRRASARTREYPRLSFLSWMLANDQPGAETAPTYRPPALLRCFEVIDSVWSRMMSPGDRCDVVAVCIMVMLKRPENCLKERKVLARSASFHFRPTSNPKRPYRQ